MNKILAHLMVYLIHHKRKGFTKCSEQLSQIAVGRGNFGSAIDHEQDMGRHIKGYLACFRISVGMSASSFGIIPPVSIKPKRLPRYSASP